MLGPVGWRVPAVCQSLAAIMLVLASAALAQDRTNLRDVAPGTEPDGAISAIQYSVPPQAASQQMVLSQIPSDFATVPRIHQAAVAPAESSVPLPRLTAPTQHESAPSKPQFAPVPRLLGLPLAEAEAMLRQARLGPTVSSGSAPASPSAKITAQQPLPGTSVPIGSRVSVTVAAPPPQLVAAPNLVGRSLADAEGLLQQVLSNRPWRTPGSINLAEKGGKWNLNV